MAKQPYEKSCAGKFGFETHAAARHALGHRRADNLCRRSRNGLQLGIYRCRFCHAFHIGNQPRGERKPSPTLGRRDEEVAID